MHFAEILFMLLMSKKGSQNHGSHFHHTFNHTATLINLSTVYYFSLTVSNKYILKFGQIFLEDYEGGCSHFAKLEDH